MNESYIFYNENKSISTRVDYNFKKPEDTVQAKFPLHQHIHWYGEVCGHTVTCPRPGHVILEFQLQVFVGNFQKTQNLTCYILNIT